MATWNSDGSQPSVQGIIDNPAFVNGDTVTIPAGTFRWTAVVQNRGKGLNIIGTTTWVSDITQSKGFWGAAVNYVLNDVVESEGQSNTSFWICVLSHINHQPPNVTYWRPLCNDTTVLVTDGPSGHPFISCTITNNTHVRISGLTLTQGTMPYAASTGFLAVADGFSENPSYTKDVRIDHCHFTNQINYAYGLYIGPGVRGVIDHSVYDLLTKNNPQNCQNKLQNGSLLPDSSWCGDNTWAQSSGWGTDDFWYFEDCYMTQDTGTLADSAGYGADGESGTRYVVRYCHLFNEIEFLCHGMEGGRQRGGRAQEYYNNDYHIKVGTGLDGVRSGGLIIHDNTYNAGPGDVTPSGYGLQAYRNIHDYGGTWGGATGFNVWDYNATDVNLGHTDGLPGYEFFRGTVDAFNRQNLSNSTFTCNAANFPINRWVGYQLSTLTTTGNYRILSNTANTISVYEWGDPAGTQNPNIGEIFRIGYVIHTANGPCQGQGDRITGANPTPVGWMHNAIGECYAWNNQGVGFAPSTPNLISGVDYHNGITMPGYTPLAYPHPLVGGVAVTKIISLSGPGLAFGNVTIGSISPTAILTVANSGNTLLTVTVVSYPSGFSGPTTGFTVAAGSSFDLVVTFTPLLPQLYSGNITVTSDATGGVNTIACSGTGVNPTPPGPHGHRKQARDAFQF